MLQNGMGTLEYVLYRARNRTMDRQQSEMVGWPHIGFRNVWKFSLWIEAINDRRGDLCGPILSRYQWIQGPFSERS